MHTIKERKPGGEMNLTEGSILRAILVFTSALLGSIIFQNLYNTADTMIIGHMLGDDALAAVGCAGPIFDTLTSLAFGLGNGMAIITARHFGNGDEDKVKRSAAAAIVIGLASAILLTLVTYLALGRILSLIKTPADLIGETYSYISVIVLFIGIMFAYNLCSALLRAIGNSFMPLVFLIISSGINIVLDIAFVGPLHMGIRGTAIATVLAQGISLILCLIYIRRSVRILIPERKHFSPDWSMYLDMFGQGMAMGLMNSIVNCGSVILQSGINDLGTLTIAGHIAARKLFSLLSMPLFALCNASGPLISQNYGAGKIDRVRKAEKEMYLLCWICCGAVCLLTLLAAPAMVTFISGSSAPELIDHGARYLRFGTPFFGILGMLIVARVSLQGLGNKILPVSSSFIELAGKILFVKKFIPLYGYTAVIFCEPLIWCFMAAYLLPAFWLNHKVRKSRRQA